MNNISAILIDPLVGFCSPSGSLCKKYGSGELSQIREAIPKIIDALSATDRKHLIRSEYSVAQFTNENIDNELAYLCVPGANRDCELLGSFSATDFDSISVKNEQDALSSAKFLKEVDGDIQKGTTIFIVMGFFLDHCVKTTAESLNIYLASCNASVVVCNDLSASRSEKYNNGVVAYTLNILSDMGVKVKTWQDIKTLSR